MRYALRITGKTVLWFGRYQECTLEEIVENDRGYLLWLCRQNGFQDRNPELYKWIMVNVMGIDPTPEPAPVRNPHKADAGAKTASGTLDVLFKMLEEQK